MSSDSWRTFNSVMEPESDRVRPTRAMQSAEMWWPFIWSDGELIKGGSTHLDLILRAQDKDKKVGKDAIFGWVYGDSENGKPVRAYITFFSDMATGERRNPEEEDKAAIEVEHILRGWMAKMDIPLEIERISRRNDVDLGPGQFHDLGSFKGSPEIGTVPLDLRVAREESALGEYLGEPDLIGLDLEDDAYDLPIIANDISPDGDFTEVGASPLDHAQATRFEYGTPGLDLYDAFIYDPGLDRIWWGRDHHPGGGTLYHTSLMETVFLDMEDAGKSQYDFWYGDPIFGWVYRSNQTGEQYWGIQSDYAAMNQDDWNPSNLKKVELHVKQRYPDAEWFDDDPEPSLARVAAWDDVQQKAQRLRSSGQVQLISNGPNHVVGRVQGDHGIYTTQFWREDPNSRAITHWECQCPWNEFAWQRTRQWKKYEGRPCSHTMALFWESLSRPLDVAPTGERLPGQRYAPGQRPGQEQLFSPLMSPPAPTPQAEVPYGPPIPPRIPSGPGIQPGIAPTPIPGSGNPLPRSVRKGPNQVPPQYGQPQAPQAPPQTPMPGIPIGAPPSPPRRTAPQGPGAPGQLTIPGALSYFREAALFADAAFQNGDIVRAIVPLHGTDRDGAQRYVPRNARGEVIYSDEYETIVIFPLHESAELEPHLVRVQTETKNLVHSGGSPFIRRKRARNSLLTTT